MQYNQLVILLSCHSLEDFPIHLTGDDAESLLSNWIALWHPALIDSASSMPSWTRIDDPPEDCQNKLIVVPTNSEPSLPTGFADRVAEQGGHIVRKLENRSEVIAEVLSRLSDEAALDHELVEDFFALGYIYLQIQLMTRHLRYSSNLDETHFSTQVVAAANAAQNAEFETAAKKLQSCFDLLREERNRYYPVEALLVDLTLVADTTIGKSFARQLTSQHPVSYMVTGETVEKMAKSQPANLSELRSALESETANIVGGTQAEYRLPLLSIESIVDQFEYGHQTYVEHLGRRPNVYGRRRYGLTTAIPQVLESFGYSGVIHAAMDDGQIPDGSQANISWEAPDGTSIDAVGCPPVDAALPETFLKLGISIGESIDVSHSASVVFAHWPAKVHPCLVDLAVSCRYGNVLGMFVTIEDYFIQVPHPGYDDSFNEDQYRSPYHRQSIIQKLPDPVSRLASYWTNEIALRSLNALNTFRFMETGKQCESDVGALRRQLDSATECDDVVAAAKKFNQIEQAIEEARVETISAIQQSMSSSDDATSSDADKNLVVINSCSFPRRMLVETEIAKLANCQQDEIYCSAVVGEMAYLLVDCPAMGYTRISPKYPPSSSDSKTAKKKKTKRKAAQPGVVEENVLRNEFFELEVDRETGGIRSLHLYDKRGNLMTQRLALRTGKGGRSRSEGHVSSGSYSNMVCDSLQVEFANSAFGRIRTRGKLIVGETHVANFNQAVTVLRGRRVFELAIELDPIELPIADPWNSYYCSRLAWYDETAELYRAVNDSRHFVGNNRIEAPVYLDVKEDNHRLTLLTGGLPFHFQPNRRMLDSLLITAGESCRKFRMGIGIDLTHPMQSAIDFAAPPVVASVSAGSSANQQGWCFHLSSKNIIATDCHPIGSGEEPGMRLRLKETEGRAGQLKIRCAKPVKSGYRTRLDGTEVAGAEVRDGEVKVNFRGHEFFQVELYW